MQTMKRPQSWLLINEMAGLDIDRPAATVLMVLIAREATQCRLHEIAELLNVEAPSVTRKVQQLEKAGLVSRRQDDQDKRSYDLKATKLGHEVAAKIQNAQRQITRQAFDTWSTSERENFVKQFERFCRNTAELYNVKLDKNYSH